MRRSCGYSGCPVRSVHPPCDPEVVAPYESVKCRRAHVIAGASRCPPANELLLSRSRNGDKFVVVPISGLDSTPVFREAKDGRRNSVEKGEEGAICTCEAGGCRETTDERM